MLERYFKQELFAFCFWWCTNPPPVSHQPFGFLHTIIRLRNCWQCGLQRLKKLTLKKHPQIEGQAKPGWQGRCGVNHWECWATSTPRSQMILTDQSWHTVELWVIWTLSLPRFHSAWLQMEDVFLKWENHTETAINSVLFYLSLKFPVGGTKAAGVLPGDRHSLMREEILE